MSVEFAHPVERALARVLDAHGITWEYEPHTIVLERDDKGDVEAFTPDFFLPDLVLYLECTVMRESLTRRKRRKAPGKRAGRRERRDPVSSRLRAPREQVGSLRAPRRRSAAA